MTPTVYTDGHALSLGSSEADHLAEKGLIEKHPGAGSDGITEEDWRLTPEASWRSISDALADLHAA